VDRFATALLPFLFLSLQDGGSEGLIDRFGSVPLHPRHHMAIQIQCNADPSVSQSLACDLEMDAICEQVGRVSVPQIVEPEASEAGLGYGASPLLGDMDRRRQGSVREPNNEVLFREAFTEPQKLLGALGAV
jgi:hypothetical protein